MTYLEEIKGLRDEINKLNEEIIVKLAARVAAAEAIAKVKRQYGKPIRDAVRERAVLQSVRNQAVAHGLDPNGVEKAFQAIIDLCVEAEKRQ